MARIRHIEIHNFRAIQHLEWYPSPGLNCLIGPGDSGKSTILDAIELCLGIRRNPSITDADFYRLNVEEPISISITIGELDDSLMNLDAYGAYLRSFNPNTGIIEDEPEVSGETVLTINTKIGSDLEALWTLVSERAEAQGLEKFLTWADRKRLSPTRIGVLADQNLAWRKGSVLNKLSDERADASAALAHAAREARIAFGDRAEVQLGETLGIVAETASELGIPVGENLKAMLDAHSATFSGGTIALHNADGVPLRSLGVGSVRLLLAGLQRKAAEEATVILIDELEYGLEPHRIVRLLGSIGAKEIEPPLQGFITTHSPIALRELNGSQLVVIRKLNDSHAAEFIGSSNVVQGTIRLFPEAFLAPSVIVCEGASEVGLIRGLDLYYEQLGYGSLNAWGVGLIDANGATKIYGRTPPFLKLGYRTAVLRDDDTVPDTTHETNFISNGGALFKWRSGRALEDEIFLSLSDNAILLLLQKAITLHGADFIDDQLQSASNGAVNLQLCQDQITPTTRTAMATASKSKRNPWFKSVGMMEEVGREIIGPDIENADPGFRQTINSLWQWMNSAS